MRRREMVARMKDAEVNAEGNGDQCWPLNREHLRQPLRDADGLLPNSWLELQGLRSTCRDGDCFEIAHYGVDPSFPTPIRNRFANTLALAKPLSCKLGELSQVKSGDALLGLRDTGIPIVLIGSSKHWPLRKALQPYG